MILKKKLGNSGNKIHYNALEKFLIDHGVEYIKQFNFITINVRNLSTEELAIIIKNNIIK